MRTNELQGMLDVGDAPPPTLLEDPEIDLMDLWREPVAYVERGDG